MSTVKEKTRTLLCPHCHGEIDVHVRTEIIEVVSAEENAGNIDWTHGMDEKEKETVQFAKKAGIFDRFTDVVNEVKFGQVPKNMERFFLNFLRLAIPKSIPRLALDALIDRFPGRISFLVNQGVGMITNNEGVYIFIPSEMVIGRSIGGKGQKSLRTSADLGEFTVWLKRRSGLVENKEYNFEKWRRTARSN